MWPSPYLEKHKKQWVERDLCRQACALAFALLQLGHGQQLFPHRYPIIFGYVLFRIVERRGASVWVATGSTYTRRIIHRGGL
jgi:hypothetical protein